MNFTELQTYGGYIGLAIYYIYATFDKQKKQSAKQKVQLDKDSEDTANSLINNLKLTTEIQDKKIAAMERREIDTGKIIAGLQAQVKLMTDILQGKDPETQKFLSLIPSMTRQVSENHEQARQNGERVERLTEAITGLVKEMRIKIEE